MNNYFYLFKDQKFKEPIKGIRIRSVYLDKAMMTYMEFEPNSVIPEHKHQHEQITIILEGKMEMVVGGIKKTVSKGDVVAIPSNTTHSAQILEVFTIAVDAWSPVREDYK